MPCGYLVGKANLIEVKKYESQEEHQKDKNLHLADELWGNYGFVLKDVKRIKPIPARESLNFWNFDQKIK